MGPGVRSQLWSRCCRKGGLSWLPSTASGRTVSAVSERFFSSRGYDNLIQEAWQSHLIKRALESEGRNRLSQLNVICGNGSPARAALGNHDWSTQKRRQDRCDRSRLTRTTYWDQCELSNRATSRAIICVERLSSTRILHHGFATFQTRDQLEASLEQSTAKSNDALKSLADVVEKDPFLKEVRSASQGKNSGTEEETHTEVDEVIRLEKAEREYLEALGKGEVADLDLEQLETLLGEAPTGDSTIGTLYLKLGQEYDISGESAEQILRCGEKALKIFQAKDNTEDVRLEVAMALHLIATAYVKMEKYVKSLPILHESLELFESKGGEESRAAKCNVRFLLGEALSGLGKPDEALSQLRPAVAEQESILGRDHTQLGRSYRKLAEVLTQVMKHDEALPFVQQSLKIHSNAFGEGSMEVAVDRRLLAVVYIGLEEHEKALVQHHLVRKILSTSEHGSETVFVDISTADTEITLGKYDDAISTLQTAMSKVDEGSAMHALVLVNLAKVYERQKKPEVANKYAKKVLVILENKVLANRDPLAVAEGFTELAALYERISQTEHAIEMLKKAHAIYAPIPHQRNAVAGTQAQIGMLLFFTGKVDEAVPFLESAVKNLEGAVGDQNFALAMVLNHLGVANVELERLEVATPLFERAKGIFEQILGPDHDDTIAVVRNLVNTCSLLDRLDDAIKYQKEVISELRKKGGDVKEMLHEAVDHLHMLQDHSKRGTSVSQTLGSDPHQYGRVISD